MFFNNKNKQKEDELEKIRQEKLNKLKEYAKHFDGYGNVKCEHCETWIDTEYIEKQCPICNAHIPKYEWK